MHVRDTKVRLCTKSLELFFCYCPYRSGMYFLMHGWMFVSFRFKLKCVKNKRNMYSLSWSIVLGLGQYTLNKRASLLHFCTFTSSVWDARSSRRCSTRRPLNGKCWNAFRDETSSRATLLVKSVGEKLQAANTWSATWVFLFQCSEKVFDFWVLLLFFSFRFCS